MSEDALSVASLAGGRRRLSLGREVALAALQGVTVWLLRRFPRGGLDDGGSPKGEAER